MKFVRLVGLAWLLAALPAWAHADDASTAASKPATPAPAKPAAIPAEDEDFLEFLGSVDEDDEEWMDYLARTDVVKVAKAKKKTPPAPDRQATEEAGK